MKVVRVVRVVSLVCLVVSIFIVSAVDASVTFYEKAHCGGASWEAEEGVYSVKGDYDKLPFPNDEVSSVLLPKDISVYLTDNPHFEPGDNGVLLLQAKKRNRACVEIENAHHLNGKVSSVAIWNHRIEPTPSVVPNFVFDTIPSKVIFFEKPDCGGASWEAGVGEYSERGNYLRLPFPNDEVDSLMLPKYLAVYLTDDVKFEPGKHGTLLIPAGMEDQACVEIQNDKGLAGKVSSVAIWSPLAEPTPTVVVTEE